MKVNTHVQDVERSGVTGEQAFQIKTTAQAFDILSSGIYSDPILAVIRELSCNAYDAHIDAKKKDVPFIVHLPSKLEPWFSVTDNGIGLSDDDARGLYTTYFESTKQNDNDKIGAFGLGSKSPFSYAKAFDVIVRFDGKKRTYSVFLNEAGVPTIATLATIVTDEGNGVEVKLAVRDQDFGLFREKTAKILRYFPVQPIIKGAAGFQFEQKSKDAVEGDGYYAFKNDNWSKNIVAVQGNVPYRVELEHLRSKMTSELNEFLSDYAIVGYFEIGQLDVAASREEVRYDERTINNLVTKLELAREDFLKVLDKEITTLTKKGSRWDVYALLSKRFGRPQSVTNIAGDYVFKSAMFNEWVEEDRNVNVLSSEYFTIKSYRSGNGRAVPQSLAQRNIEDPNDATETIRVYCEVPTRSIQVMDNDVTKRSSIRINNYIKDSSTISEVLAIAPKSNRVLLNANIVPPTTKQLNAAYKRIVEGMGNPTIVKLSEETEDAIVQRGTPRSRTGHTFKKFLPNKYQRSDRIKPMFAEVTPSDTGGIYMEVTILRDTIVNGKKVNWNHNTFKNYVDSMLDTINFATNSNYKLEDVYGLTKKVVKSVVDDPDWKSVEEMFKASVHELHETAELAKRVNATDDSIGVCRYLADRDLKRLVSALDPKSHFRATVEPAIKAVEKNDAARKAGMNSTLLHRVESLNTMMGITYKKMVETPFFQTSDFDDYPMLVLAGISLNQARSFDITLEYIELMEK